MRTPYLLLLQIVLVRLAAAQGGHYVTGSTLTQCWIADKEIEPYGNVKLVQGRDDVIPMGVLDLWVDPPLPESPDHPVNSTIRHMNNPDLYIAAVKDVETGGYKPIWHHEPYEWIVRRTSDDDEIQYYVYIKDDEDYYYTWTTNYCDDGKFLLRLTDNDDSEDVFWRFVSVLGKSHSIWDHMVNYIVGMVTWMY